MLYPFLLLCCLCVPEGCTCKKWLHGAGFDAAIWEQLEDGQWIYEELAMSHTEQTVTCILCLEKLKQGETIMLLPCSSIGRRRTTHHGTDKNSSLSSLLVIEKTQSTLELNEDEPFQQDFSHNLHKECLAKWFARSSECPVCQTQLRVDMFELLTHRNRAGCVVQYSINHK